MTDLRDRSVLVLGATGGLGSRLARALADRGARLTLSARDRGRLEGLGIEGVRVAAGDLRLPGVRGDRARGAGAPVVAF